jgi:hypothetical protein
MYKLLFACVLATSFACSSKKSETPAAGSGSAETGSAEGSGSGSAMAAGSGSAGSAAGSATAGSGSSASAGSGSGGGGEVAAGGFDFDKLTHDEKVDFMKKKVMPTMKPLFVKFDGKKFANFNCKTCHGKDADKRKFKMPNPGLPKLDFAALKAGKQAPKMAKFMGETVKPEMAKLLQQPEFTETNPKGFGCLECHEQKKK